MTYSKQQLIVVSHTHWDREWHQPFQAFRTRLVKVVDDLLFLLAEHPEFRHFMLDGQAIILEDYLAVRPERREELTHHIRSGRVHTGPWYVMPDEFLASPEALVRNLLWGTRLAREFGALMPVGYLPDPFGHISQLPQILTGFGIDSAAIWRGVGRRARHTEFLWESPDGSTVLTLNLIQSYNNAAKLPTEPGQLMERISAIRSELTPHSTTPTLLLLNGDDHLPSQPNVPRVIRVANSRLRDAELIQGSLTDVVDRVREYAAANGVEWERVSGEFRSPELAHLLAGILSTRIGIKQRNARCEDLLEHWAEPFALFAGMVRPGSSAFSSIEHLIGDEARPFIRLGWQNLLHCQPHDSICGCSTDQVHREMQVRFDACEQVASEVAEHALTTIARAVDAESTRLPRCYSAPKRGTSHVVVFNGEGSTRDDFATVTVEPPDGAETFALLDPDGQPIPYQVLAQENSDLLQETLSREQVLSFLRFAGGGNTWSRWRIAMLERMVGVMTRGRLPRLTLVDVAVRESAEPGLAELDVDVVERGEHNYDALARGLRELQELIDRSDVERFLLRARRRDRVQIGFVAPAVPPFGYRMLRLASSRNVDRRALPEARSMTLENECLSAEVNASDGTLRVVDRETGAVYEGLNGFVDGGDAGDEYTYSPPMNDEIVSQPARPVEIEVVEDGAARRTLKATMTYYVPEELSADRQTRSSRHIPLRIATSYSISPGARRIDVRTEVENNARDHVLRVRFPTQLLTDHADADGHFAVIRRPIGLPSQTAGWLEQPVTTQPQRVFVDVSDGEHGLMIANRGLPEYEVTRVNGQVAAAITLLRCVGWLSRGDLRTRHGAAGPMLPTPEAQCPGSHVFEYSIIPHAGDWRAAAKHAYAYRIPLRTVAVGGHSGALPAAASFIATPSGQLRISAVKFPEDGSGMIVRVYNCDADTRSELRSFWPLRRAQLVRLDEQPIEDLPVDGDRVVFSIRAGQVLTFRLEVAS